MKTAKPKKIEFIQLQRHADWPKTLGTYTWSINGALLNGYPPNLQHWNHPVVLNQIELPGQGNRHNEQVVYVENIFTDDLELYKGGTDRLYYSFLHDLNQNDRIKVNTHLNMSEVYKLIKKGPVDLNKIQCKFRITAMGIKLL